MALVTLTVTVHVPLAGMVAPLNATLAAPFTAVTLPPTHVVAPEAGFALTTFAGYGSVNAAPANAAAFGFVSVIVSTLVSLVPIEPGVNVFATASPVRTVSDALAAAVFAPVLPVVRAPIAMLLL